MKKNQLFISLIICAILFSTNVIAQALPDHLVMTEIVVTPTAGEYIEIFNVTDSTIDLTNYYLTDATFSPGGQFYYNIVTGADAGGGSFADWHARFPTGATIEPLGNQTISMAGSNDFYATYGKWPTYELFEDDTTADGIPDMLEALPGSINGQGGLSDAGEVVILYYWDGQDDLVKDVDYVVWGDKNEAVDKTGVSIDGPDADTLKSTYLDDTAIANQDAIAPDGSGHPAGDSFARVVPAELEITSGGNGITGHNETGEPLTTTWGLIPTSPNGLRFRIADILEDTNMNFFPDLMDWPVTVQGVVFSPNFQTNNNEYYIWDQLPGDGPGDSRGTNIFMFGGPFFDWQPGDLLDITGTVDQFNGKAEIIPADTTGWLLLSSGNPTPEPIVMSIAQYKADPEAYEGSLVGFTSLIKVGGTWPTSSSTNLDFSDGVDTLSFRIDSDTDIPGQPEPTWPQDIIGIGSQFDGSTPPDGGYQIFPRWYATDFLPPGTIPVELTSFTAQVSDVNVILNWSTATEVNNLGFEIQRSKTNEFRTIGFVNGNGTSTEVHNYSFTDGQVEAGTYYYRLKQVDFNGLYEYSDAVAVEVEVIAPDVFALNQNYPNPFNPSTNITYSLAVDSKVTLKVFDVLGQEVVTLINGNVTAGIQELDFEASNLNSGVYFYQIKATGVDGTNFNSVKKMILTK